MNTFLALKKQHLILPGSDPSWASPVTATMKRRDARIWQLAYTAAQPLIDAQTPSPNSLVVGTALGALEETRRFLDGVFTDGLGSPRSFIASVHNSMAGRLALQFKIKGPNLTLCDSHNSLASALITINLLEDEAFPVLLCVVDERIPLLDELTPYLSSRCRPFLTDNWEEGAYAAIIDRAQSHDTCKIRAFGPVPAERRDPETVCRELAERYIPESKDLLTFGESTSSFFQPAVTLYRTIENSTTSAIIGSFSPTSGAAAIVEINQTP